MKDQIKIDLRDIEKDLWRDCHRSPLYYEAFKVMRRYNNPHTHTNIVYEIQQILDPQFYPYARA